jgi:subtilisin family serine protease
VSITQESLNGHDVDNWGGTVRILTLVALCCFLSPVLAQEVFIVSPSDRKVAQGLSPQSSRSLEHIRLMDAREGLRQLNCRTRTLVHVNQVLTLCPNGVDRARVEEHLGALLGSHFEVSHDSVLYRPGTVNESNSPSALSASPHLRDTLMMSAANGFSGNDSPSISVAPNGTQTLVAVIDTGATLSHPYLSSALNTNSAESADGIDNDGNGYVDDIFCANSIERNGNCAEVGTDHGSHVAGLVKVVRDQAIVKYPNASRVTLLPIRFIGASGVGTTAVAIAAVDYAIQRGAKVINASWGARGEAAFSQALFDAFARAYWEHNIFISVAAGNADASGPNNNDLVPYFPSSFNIPGLMSVGSVTPQYFSVSGGGQMYGSAPQSDFSNYGRLSVDIFAPGGMSNSPSDFNGGVWSVNAAYPSGPAFVRKKGTSMAAPIVAGIAAVVRALNPSLTAYEVKEVILDTGRLHSGYKDVTSSMAVQAAQAMSAALLRSSTGKKPAVTAPFYFTSSQAGSTSNRKDSGGCGLVQDASVPPDGPWGGNSLGLISALYFAFVGARKWLAQRKKFRV